MCRGATPWLRGGPDRAVPALPGGHGRQRPSRPVSLRDSNTCSTMERWGSTTRTFRGASWSAGCPAALPPARTRTAATLRPGRASVTSTSRCGLPRTPSTARYAELHAHSSFSFLDGASAPEELAEEAARLGLTSLTLTDHDGMYGVVRFAEAAETIGLATGFGAELALDVPIAPHQGRAAGRGAGRRARSARHPPARARPRPGRLREPVPHDQQGAAARRREGTARSTTWTS